MILLYDFSEEDFLDRCKNEILEKNITIFEGIYKGISHFLSFPVEDNHITEIKHKYTPEYYDNHLSIDEYIKNESIDFSYPKIELYSKKENSLDYENVVLPDFIKQQEVSYGWGVTKTIKLKPSNLKTKNKLLIEFLHLKISSSTLKKLKDKLMDSNIKQELLPSALGVWEWRQTFYNKITGDISFCSCFEESIQKEGLEINSNTHKHIKYAIENKSFLEKICHLCLNTNSDLFYCHPMYGSAFKVKYGAYIKNFEIKNQVTERDAENAIREIKGVAKIGERWINETLVFNYISILFPTYTVEREASPSWISQQRLDVYIPELQLAIEYQGEQHYKAVELFGGKEGLKKTKERDQDKLSKCRSNNIDLVYFSYKDNLSENLVASRLKKYLG